MRVLTLLAVVTLLLLTSCVEDYDVAEVAPEEHLESEEHNHEDDATCEECSNTHEEIGEDIHSDMQEEHAGGPSGHSHAEGDRNHGTQWFFNQPWAAPFIWGKLARDGLIFLMLAAILFVVTGRRKR